MYWQKYQKNKYKNINQVVEGIRYDSRKEAAYAQYLILAKKAGRIKNWRRQVKISLDVNGFHICNYYCDFEVERNDQSLELVEVKGFETEVYRLKRKLLEATFLKDRPEYTYTVIK